MRVASGRAREAKEFVVVFGPINSEKVHSGHRDGTESSRRAVYHDLVAEQTDFLVVQDLDGFVFAQLGFGRDNAPASL
jgi:hypothetical protein